MVLLDLEEGIRPYPEIAMYPLHTEIVCMSLVVGIEKVTGSHLDQRR
jgi:hypothetical protein